jgi:nicotinamidase-related amidase
VTGLGRGYAWYSFNKPSQITQGSTFQNFLYDTAHARFWKAAPCQRRLASGADGNPSPVRPLSCTRPPSENSSCPVARPRGRRAGVDDPERRQKRLASPDECAEGFKLYPALDVLSDDLHVKKIKYSAFIAGSSDIDARLKSRGIDSVLITGTATNVCCESSARDAMMLDYRVTMISDGNATWTDEEHAATLNSFLLFFGDVMTTDEAIAKLVPAMSRKSA